MSASVGTTLKSPARTVGSPSARSVDACAISRSIQASL
jgi:hypothetical protein